MAFARVRDQVEAIGALLVAVGGQACFQSVADSQAKVLSRALRSAKLCSAQVSSLIGLVAKQPWPQAHKEALLGKLAELTSAGDEGAVAGRAQQQD